MRPRATERRATWTFDAHPCSRTECASAADAVVDDRAMARLSATLESDALATGENEATQTDWVGDLSGRLGVDSAARRGWGAAAAGREAVGYRAVDGR